MYSRLGPTAARLELNGTREGASSRLGQNGIPWSLSAFRAGPRLELNGTSWTKRHPVGPVLVRAARLGQLASWTERHPVGPVRVLAQLRHLTGRAAYQSFLLALSNLGCLLIDIGIFLFHISDSLSDLIGWDSRICVLIGESVTLILLWHTTYPLKRF